MPKLSRLGLLRGKVFSKRSSTFSSGVEMMVFNVINLVFNFGKSVIIAVFYGANALTDAYYAANTLIQTPTGLISDSLNALILPRIQRSENKREFLSSYSALVGLIFGVITMAFAGGGYALGFIVLRGFDAEKLGLVYRLILLSLPIVFFSPLVGLFDNALRSGKYLVFGNIGRLANSIGAFLLLLLIYRLGVTAILLSSVVGLLLNFALLIYVILRKRMLAPRVDIGQGWREARRALPLIVGGIVGIGTAYIERGLASFLDPGTITLMNMGMTLTGVVKSLFVSTLIVVFYPFISEALAAKDTSRYANLLRQGKTLVFGFFGLIASCIWAFSYPLFLVLYGHGKFSEASVATLARFFNIYSFGFIYAALSNLSGYSFYSNGDVKRPVINSILTTSLMCVAIQFAAVGRFGALGLVAAPLAASIVNIIIDGHMLKKFHGISFWNTRDLLHLIVMAIASGVLGVLPWSPYFIALPILYYFAVSRPIYGLTIASIVRLIRRKTSPDRGVEARTGL